MLLHNFTNAVFNENLKDSGLALLNLSSLVDNLSDQQIFIKSNSKIAEFLPAKTYDSHEDQLLSTPLKNSQGDTM